MSLARASAVDGLKAWEGRTPPLLAGATAFRPFTDVGGGACRQVAEWMQLRASSVPGIAPLVAGLKSEQWLRFHLALPAVHATRSIPNL